MTPLDQVRQKLFLRENLVATVAEWKAARHTIVFTNGCFDIIHPGHVDYLAKAAGLGDKIIIGVNTDNSVQRLKGPNRPIQDQDSRSFVLAALGFTSAIILFDEETPAHLIALLKPDILVKGADYTIDQVIGADTVLQSGGSVVLLPYLAGFSTSAIANKIRQNP